MFNYQSSLSYKSIGILFILLLCNLNRSFSQVSYNAAGAYSLRKTIPSYNGNAIQVRRTCDDVTKDIGFTTCGELDTVALKKFVIASNPLSVITTSATAAYSLRKLRCTYAGNSINVRRACDNATKDIGFTAEGDLDTNTLKTFVLASNPLNSISSGATAAYSLRKLRCAYVGSAIRVRRSNDNTASNIGFTINGDLDTVALKTFVGTNSGYVTTWYDQSGNNKNVTQATVANQPRIINAGVIERQNGMPAIRFISASSTILSANTLMVTDRMTVSVVAKLNNASTRCALFDLSGSGSNFFVVEANTYNTTGNKWGLYPNDNSLDAAAATSTNLTSLSLVANNTFSSSANIIANTNFYVNGTSAALSCRSCLTNVYRPSWVNGFVIGNFNGYSSFLDGFMTELIVLPSALSNIDREYIEWTQGQYYNIGGISLSAMPSASASAFVTTWYDQSGNGKNVSQATLSRQPQIVNAGVIERQNGMPAIRFIGSSVSTFSTNTLMVSDNMSISVVAKLNSLTVRNALFDLSSPGGSFQHFVMEANTYQTTGSKWGFYANNTSMDAAAPTSTILTSLSLVANNTYTSTATITTNTSYYLNGAAVALSLRTGANMYRSSWLNGFVIGNFNGYGANLDGYMTELIVLPSALSNTDRQFIEWTQGQYYNISGINLSGMPLGAANAYVTKWYDQSGGGFHATQTTNANQPRIINVGILEKSGTKPAIKFNGTAQTLTVTTPVGVYPVTISVLANTSGLTTNGAFVKLGGIVAGSSGIGIGVGATGSSYDNTGFSLIGLKEWASWCPSNPGVSYPATPFVVTETQQSAAGGSALNAYLNGTNIPLNNNTSATSGTTITGLLYIGGYQNGTNRFPVIKETEVIIFPSTLNTTRRTLLETNQSSHYNISISNSKYTPPTATSYNLYVNGIGRESSTDSVGGTRSTMGMGVSVTTAASSFLKDNGDYLAYGMNCYSLPFTSSSNLPATVVQRWENDWYVNKTDVSSNNGIMSIFFDFSDYGVAISPGLAANYVLLYRSSSAGTFSIVPNTTVTTVGDRVVFDVDGSNITTNYYYTIGTKNTSTSPLPIELLGFNCNMLNSKTVELTWSTASELNIDYFSVERSSDAVTYQSIGKINGAGNSVTTKHYSLVDENALEEISYYRLKSVDLDGSYKYSSLCSVSNQGSALNGDILIYPNPTNGLITVDFTRSVYTQPDFYSLMDITGKKIEVPSVRNNTIISIDMSSLQAGMYMLEIIKGNQKSVKKITLQK